LYGGGGGDDWGIFAGYGWGFCLILGYGENVVVKGKDKVLEK